MNKEDMLKIAKENKSWSVASGPCVYQLCRSFMIGFMRMSRCYKEYYKYVFMLFEKNIGFQYGIHEQSFKNVKQMYDDAKKTRGIIERWKKQKRDFVIYCKKKAEGAEKLKDGELYDRYCNFIDRFGDIWMLPLAVDVIGAYTETSLLDEFLDSTKDKGIKKRLLVRYFGELCHPIYTLFIKREHLSILRLALLYKKEGMSKIFLKRLEEHQNNYFWIENNYRIVKVLDKKYFLEKIKKESRKSEEEINKKLREDKESLKNKRESIIKKLGLKGKIKEDVLLTQDLSEWLDLRKEVNMYGDHYLNEILKEMSKRKKLTLEEIYYLTPNEIKCSFLEGSEIDRKKVKDRMRVMVYVIEQPENETIFEGKDAEDIINALKYIKKDYDVKGTVASFGSKEERFIRGKVRIVLDVTKSKFEEGEILVASMTRPEYVPMMGKAKAIITDEGGITSHAAIVSRELGVPCIIGTRVATDVLKNGDIVEIDMDDGIVRKIK